MIWIFPMTELVYRYQDTFSLIYHGEVVLDDIAGESMITESQAAVDLFDLFT